MNDKFQPQAFTGAPALPRHPQQHGVRVVEGPERFVPPPPPMPTLTLGSLREGRGTHKLYLTTLLMSALNLRAGQAIGMIPPVHGSLFWHLDLRAFAPGVIAWAPPQGPRVEGIRLPPGLVTAPLVLHLMPGPPMYENVYPLLPENAFTP